MRKRRDQVGKPPLVGWIKLNTNGARDSVSRDALAAAVARDDFGTCCGGVERNIGKCSAVQAEFWDIYDGLFMAWDNN
ncbi:hypothetical protein PVK06_016646 [Gossypium arboreum]|uniref:RNase H type-1 domain-containing protein n=1 Tax=Gossypium arboreum TaxID=29729 RepID=A0ABR0Q0M5_GOSAR|nr:hypothetical protein PVK06_016646 [Gossypium arboreum]